MGTGQKSSSDHLENVKITKQMALARQGTWMRSDMSFAYIYVSRYEAPLYTQQEATFWDFHSAQARGPKYCDLVARADE